MNLYDATTKLWGNGHYGPKWISTNYTLLELKYLEIDPNNLIYQESLINYLDYYFTKYINKSGILSMDLCLSGMFINLLSYGKINDNRLNLILDYVLDKTMPDGAWNCMWNHDSKPKISSVHTTINVLEGLQEYINQGYIYRIEEVKESVETAINTLLERNLIYKKGTQNLIHQSMAKHHYPPRWKYDYLRILEFLAKKSYPYGPEIKPAMEILLNSMKNGRLTKGTTIPGKIHFQLETEIYGRFNTLRAYIVLKRYSPIEYENIINKAII